MTIFLIILLIVVLLFGLTALTGAPYVPTRKNWARAALDLARPGADDLVVDLGSGDGVILKLAALGDARAIGYEINPLLVLLSKIRLRKIPLANAKLKNFWRANLPPQTTIVYIFTCGRDVRRLVKYLRRQRARLDHPLKIVSFGFALPSLKMTRKNSGARLYEI
ncbi:MAG: hypothetical protein LBM73_00875 [Candidatus Nomurabacteria bacterium]|jgi:hypothetical protein|nr:hypothetical protein [Candidatus Nomurabacteria bacterium]